ncbi:MAG: DUF4393 domain-containing protein [Enterocloster aldenensis]|nr:DUF4393 domain-containing protein [Enterocloster aldenensis]
MDIIPKFLDSALTPVGKEVGERLADIVSLVFTPVMKAKARRDNNLKLFLEDLDKKVNEIPEDKLREPPLNIVGPALDDVAKFYNDEEYLRKSFAKLIASSMNKDCYVHPSFIKTIEQLSPDDARIIYKVLVPMGLHYTNHVDNIFIDGQFTLIFIEGSNLKRWQDATLLFTLPRENKIPRRYPDQLVLKRSLTNLERLGLIFFSDLRESGYKLELFPNVPNNGVYEVTVAATNYGTSFANVCCENPYDNGDYIMW